MPFLYIRDGNSYMSKHVAFDKSTYCFYNKDSGVK
jgi:hypothetical protein